MARLNTTELYSPTGYEDTALQTHLAKEISRKEQAAKALKDYHNEIAAFNPELKKHLENYHNTLQTQLYEHHNKRLKAIHDFYKANPTLLFNNPRQFKEDLDTHLNSQGLHRLDKFTIDLARKLKKYSSVPLTSNPIEKNSEYEVENPKGINQNFHDIFNKKVLLEPVKNKLNIPRKFNGSTEDLYTLESQANYNPNTNTLEEPHDIAENFNAMSKGLNTNNIQILHGRGKPVRASTNHALHMLFGGNLLPAGISKFLGSNGFKIQLIPQDHDEIGYHKHVQQFLETPRLNPNEHRSFGGRYSGRFQHHVTDTENIGRLHEPDHINIGRSHEEGISNGAALAGLGLMHIVQQKAITNPKIQRALKTFSQEANKFGFKSADNLMEHLMRHYAMSAYSAASELGDDQHNILGNKPVVGDIDSEKSTLEFLQGLHSHSPNLADSFKTLLEESKAISPIRHMVEDVKAGGFPEVQTPTFYKHRLGEDEIPFEENEEQNKRHLEEAKKYKVPNVISHGNPRGKIVLAAKREINSYPEALQKQLNGLKINIHGHGSKHAAMEAWKNAPENENNPLPGFNEEKNTGLNNVHINSNGRELNIYNPVQKGEAAESEVKNVINEQIGRHIFQKAGADLHNGKIIDQNAPIGRFIKSAENLYRMGFGKNAKGIVPENLQTIIAEPENKHYEGLVNKNLNNLVSLGYHTFNNLFKGLHKFEQDRVKQLIDSGKQIGPKERFQIYVDYMKRLKDNLETGVTKSPYAGTGLQRRNLINNIRQLHETFNNIMMPYYQL